MRNHKDLIVWQKSMALVRRLYEVTRAFPQEELFGLTSQMRRAAVSIPSNIAEGYGRIYDKERINFLSIALGSASELETQLIISNDLGFMNEADSAGLSSLNNEVILMLSSLIKGLRCGKSPC
jgi:four helix bundle protein